MILNSNTLNRIDKKMILELRFGLNDRDRLFGALRMYFYVNNESVRKLDEETKLSMLKSIRSFYSIRELTTKREPKYTSEIDCIDYRKGVKVTPNSKFITFWSQVERDFFVKQVYSCGIACKYPAFLKINDNYFFLNELNFINYAKEDETDLLWDKYDEIDCFIIENVYGLDVISKKGYKKENKEYKLIRE